MNKEQQFLLAASMKANYNQVLNQLQNQPELFQDTYFINQLVNQIGEYQERASPALRLEYQKIAFLLKKEPFPVYDHLQQTTTASITGTDGYTNSYDAIDDSDIFNLETNDRRFTQKTGAHGQQRTSDYDTGHYLPENTVEFLQEISKPNQAKKSTNDLSPYPVVTRWESELFSMQNQVTPGKLYGIPYYVVNKPFDVKSDAEINWLKKTVEAHFCAGGEYRIIVPYTRLLSVWLKDNNISHTIDFISAKASIDGKFELNYERPNVEFSAQAGISGFSTSFDIPTNSMTMLGLVFTPKLSGDYGYGVAIKAGIGACLDLNKYKCRVYGLFGVFLGEGGSINPELEIGIDTELSQRFQDIISTHPLFTDVFPKWHNDLEKSYAQEINYNNFVTRALGALEKEIGYAIGNSFINVVEEGVRNLAAVSAILPRVKSKKDKKSLKDKLPKPKISEQNLPKADNTEHAKTFIDTQKEPSKSEGSEDNRQNFSVDFNSTEQAENMPPQFVTEKGPNISLPVQTGSTQNVPMVMRALLGVGARTRAKTAIQSLPVVKKVTPLLAKKIETDFQNYIRNKIVEDANRAKLQAVPSIPPQADRGIMKGFIFKKDERGQDGIHYRLNHTDSNNSHGMDIEFGISFRAAFELLKLAGAAWNRANNYTEKQKKAYHLIKFIGNSDRSEANYLEFEKRLKNVKLSEAETKYFRYIFFTGNAEELLPFKEMILDKNNDTHKEIRKKLGNIFSQLDSNAPENKEIFNRFNKNNNEENLSLYVDMLYAALRPEASDLKRQDFYHAIGSILYVPDLVKDAIHDLSKNKREEDFKRYIEPKLKKALDNYVNARQGKANLASKFEALVTKSQDIYHDEMADYQLQFYLNRGKESDCLKARDILNKKGKVSEANAITHDLAKKYPHNMAYIDQSGLAHAKQGDFANAILQWQKLDSLSTESQSLLYAQIRKLEKENNFPAAKELCEKFIPFSKTADENYAYIHWYVSLCFETADYPTGISQLEKLMKDYEQDKEKYETTAGILLNAYGIQARVNDTPLNKLQGEWLDKILNNDGLNNINTILAVLKFYCLQGNLDKAIHYFKHYQTEINQHNSSRDSLKAFESFLIDYLHTSIDEAISADDFKEFDRIEKELAQFSQFSRVRGIFSEIREIKTLSKQRDSARTLEQGGELAFMMACQLEENKLRKIAISVFAAIKGTATALLGSASEWLGFSKEIYALNRALDSEALTHAQRATYTKRLADLQNSSFLAHSGTYHMLSSILTTGKRWHAAFIKDPNALDTKDPTYAHFDTLIVASDSTALYLDANALEIDWKHQVDVANVALQATRLALDTLVTVDQLAEEWYGKNFGLKENAWIKTHLPESLRLAGSAVAIASDLHPVTATVHMTSMFAPHATTHFKSYLNPTQKDIENRINTGEYSTDNEYISAAACLGGFKKSCDQISSGIVIHTAVTTGKGLAAAAMTVPQVAAAVNAVGATAATVGGTIVAGASAAGGAIATGAATAGTFVATTATTVGAATGITTAATAVGGAAATAGAAIATGASAVGGAIATGAATAGTFVATTATTVGAATGITTAATAVGGAAATAGGAIATGASAVGGAIASGAATLGTATGVTAAAATVAAETAVMIEVAMPIIIANASAAAASTWGVVVAVAPFVGGFVLVVGIGTIGYNIYSYQYDMNTNQYYVNAFVSMNKGDLDRVSQDYMTYRNRSDTTNTTSWEDWYQWGYNSSVGLVLEPYQEDKQKLLEKQAKVSHYAKISSLETENLQESAYSHHNLHTELDEKTKGYALSAIPAEKKADEKSPNLYLKREEGRLYYKPRLSSDELHEITLQDCIDAGMDEEKIRSIFDKDNTENFLMLLEPYKANLLTITFKKASTPLNDSILQLIAEIKKLNDKYPQLNGPKYDELRGYYANGDYQELLLRADVFLAAIDNQLKAEAVEREKIDVGTNQELKKINDAEIEKKSEFRKEKHVSILQLKGRTQLLHSKDVIAARKTLEIAQKLLPENRGTHSLLAHVCIMDLNQIDQKAIKTKEIAEANIKYLRPRNELNQAIKTRVEQLQNAKALKNEHDEHMKHVKKYDFFFASSAPKEHYERIFIFYLKDDKLHYSGRDTEGKEIKDIDFDDLQLSVEIKQKILEAVKNKTFNEFLKHEDVRDEILKAMTEKKHTDPLPTDVEKAVKEAAENAKDITLESWKIHENSRSYREVECYAQTAKMLIDLLSLINKWMTTTKKSQDLLLISELPSEIKANTLILTPQGLFEINAEGNAYSSEPILTPMELEELGLSTSYLSRNASSVGNVGKLVNSTTLLSEALLQKLSEAIIAKGESGQRNNRLINIANVIHFVLSVVQFNVLLFNQQIELLKPQTTHDQYNHSLQASQAVLSILSTFLKMFKYVLPKIFNEGWENYFLPCMQLGMSIATTFINRFAIDPETGKLLASMALDPLKIMEGIFLLSFESLLPTVLVLLNPDPKDAENFDWRFFMVKFLENLGSQKGTLSLFLIDRAHLKNFNSWISEPVGYIKNVHSTLLIWEDYIDRNFINIKVLDSFFSHTGLKALSPFYRQYILSQRIMTIVMTLGDTMIHYKQNLLCHLRDKAIKGNKNPANAAYYQGMIFENDKDWPAARQCYLQAIEHGCPAAQENLRKLDEMPAQFLENVSVAENKVDLSQPESNITIRRAVILFATVGLLAQPPVGAALFLGSIISCFVNKERFLPSEFSKTLTQIGIFRVLDKEAAVVIKSVSEQTRHM